MLKSEMLFPVHLVMVHLSHNNENIKLCTNYQKMTPRSFSAMETSANPLTYPNWPLHVVRIQNGGYL